MPKQLSWLTQKISLLVHVPNVTRLKYPTHDVSSAEQTKCFFVVLKAEIIVFNTYKIITLISWLVFRFAANRMISNRRLLIPRLRELSHFQIQDIERPIQFNRHAINVFIMNSLGTLNLVNCCEREPNVLCFCSNKVLPSGHATEECTQWHFRLFGSVHYNFIFENISERIDHKPIFRASPKLLLSSRAPLANIVPTRIHPTLPHSEN